MSLTRYVVVLSSRKKMKESKQPLRIIQHSNSSIIKIRSWHAEVIREKYCTKLFLTLKFHYIIRIADTNTSPQKKQRSDDVSKTVEFSNYEVSSPEESDTNTIKNGSNMNPEPAEVLNLSPVIERNASIELSPGISEKEYDFFYISLYIRDRSRFFCASWAWNYVYIYWKLYLFQYIISSSDLTYEQSR